MANRDLTAAQARDALSYDPQTGHFTRHSTGRRADWRCGSGYMGVRLLGRTMNAHRVAWLMHYGEHASGVIDHINGDRTDNRIANLRDTSQSENIRAKRVAKGISGVVGVCYQKSSDGWVARISIARGQPCINLGWFKRLEDAIAARKAAEMLYRAPLQRAVNP